MNKGRLYYHSLSQVLWGSPELNARVTVGVHRDTLRWACHASIYCELASCCLSSLVKGHGLSVLQIYPAFLALFTSGHISAKNRNCTTEISSCRSISQLPPFLLPSQSTPWNVVCISELHVHPILLSLCHYPTNNRFVYGLTPGKWASVYEITWRHAQII